MRESTSLGQRFLVPVTIVNVACIAFGVLTPILTGDDSAATWIVGAVLFGLGAVGLLLQGIGFITDEKEQP